MAKRFLLIRGVGDDGTRLVSNLDSICGLLGLEFVDYTYTDLVGWEHFTRNDSQYNFLYLASSGDHAAFGDSPESGYTRWADFAAHLASTEVLRPDSVLFLGTSHRNFKRAALVVFSNCQEIAYVAGTQGLEAPSKAALQVHVFLHNFLTADEESSVAARRTENALGISFPLYDRYALEAELAILLMNGGIYFPDYVPLVSVDASSRLKSV